MLYGKLTATLQGYIGGHCPFIDQCVFTHMDKEDIFDWLKVRNKLKL